MIRRLWLPESYVFFHSPQIVYRSSPSLPTHFPSFLLFPIHFQCPIMTKPHESLKDTLLVKVQALELSHLERHLRFHNHNVTCNCFLLFCTFSNGWRLFRSRTGVASCWGRATGGNRRLGPIESRDGPVGIRVHGHTSATSTATASPWGGGPQVAFFQHLDRCFRCLTALMRVISTQAQA